MFNRLLGARVADRTLSSLRRIPTLSYSFGGSGLNEVERRNVVGVIRDVHNRGVVYALCRHTPCAHEDLPCALCKINCETVGLNRRRREARVIDSMDIFSI